MKISIPVTIPDNGKPHKILVAVVEDNNPRNEPDHHTETYRSVWSVEAGNPEPQEIS